MPIKIRERGSRYYLRFKDTSRSPKEKTVSLSQDAWTKREAQQYYRELYHKWEKGEWDPWTGRHPRARPQEPTLKQALARYCEKKRADGKRGIRGGWTEKTTRGKKSVLEDFVREAGGHVLVSELDYDSMHDYVHNGELAVATRKGYRKAINAFVNHLRGEGYEVPQALPPLSDPVPIPEYVTEKELYKICTEHCKIMAEEAAKKHSPAHVAWKRGWMTEVWRFAFYQGFRRSEVFSLTPRHIDLERNTIQVGDAAFRQKNREQTIIPLTPPARAVILPFLTDDPEGREASKIRSGSPIFDYSATYYVSRAFKSAARKVLAEDRVEDLRFHSLRHSCAVYWRRRGVSLADIRDLLRHKSITSTEIYDKMVPTDLVGRFERAYRETSQSA